ncbi:hypothetical protein ACFXG4_27165 [Nocardia sp. NPDC059246]|uniref:hypothetical protein n=1 Tax=unclassified Nocardia TaxID=2637762 RepID=UPI0036837335
MAAQANSPTPPPGVERVIRLASATYITPERRAVHGSMGETVLVHPDHVARFDELNVPPSFVAVVDKTPNIIDARQPTAVEARIAQGFGNGNQPLTIEARAQILAAEEAAAKAAEDAAGS